MSLRLKFNLLLGGLFVIGMLVSTVVLYRVAQTTAVEQIEAQIQVLRAKALAVRKYTSEEIRPLLRDASDVQFLPQTVPSFSAQNVFRKFGTLRPGFYYKEAVLNPTNKDDLATPWEAKLIEQLRADPSLAKISTIRSTDEGDQYTVAFPLKVSSQTCLTCHSTPEKAPASMIDLYGKEGGFGWKLDETVGAQVFSAPMSIAYDYAFKTLQVMVVSMGLVFVAVLVILNILLSRMVISPVSRMAEIAEQVSMGDNSPDEYQHPGSDEIASLSASFNRMRRSLDNAMRMLDS